MGVRSSARMVARLGRKRLGADILGMTLGAGTEAL